MRVYDEVEYAKTRLLNTIVRYKDKPISVADISANGLVSFYYIDTEKVGNCQLKDLNLDPVPLGYVNTDKNSYYAVRMPMRNDWKQGLRDTNIRSWDGTKILSYVNWFHISKTIQGEFTPYKGCLKMTTEGKSKSQAFGRNFALVRNEEKIDTPQLFFKGKFNVGVVSGKKPILEDKFGWLSEMLELEYSNAN